MKVILLVDIPKVGRRYETKEVATGFARNVLIPANKVLPATPENIKKVSAKKQILDQENQKKLNTAIEIATALKDQVVSITLPAGDKGQLFSALHEKDVAEAIFASLKIRVSPESISWTGPIKKTGQFPAVFLEMGQRAPFVIMVEAV